MNYDHFGFLTLEQIKKAVILERIKSFGGNKEAAARSLDVHKQTLYNNLEEYDKMEAEERRKIDAAMADANYKIELQRPSYKIDPATGMSVPVKPEPMPGEEKVLLNVSKIPLQDEIDALVAKRDKDGKKGFRIMTAAEITPSIADQPFAKKREDLPAAIQAQESPKTEAPLMFETPAEAERASVPKIPSRIPEKFRKKKAANAR